MRAVHPLACRNSSADAFRAPRCPGSPLPVRRRPSEFPHFLCERVLLILPGDRDIRTKLGATGEYYRAFVVTEERVTKWPAPRDEVEYDVLRVSVNVHIN